MDSTWWAGEVTPISAGTLTFTEKHLLTCWTSGQTGEMSCFASKSGYSTRDSTTGWCTNWAWLEPEMLKLQGLWPSGVSQDCVCLLRALLLQGGPFCIYHENPTNHLKLKTYKNILKLSENVIGFSWMTFVSWVESFVKEALRNRLSFPTDSVDSVVDGPSLVLRRCPAVRSCQRHSDSPKGDQRGGKQKYRQVIWWRRLTADVWNIWE